ncbi:DNA polymerase [Marinomonas sp. SBI22]|uniref:antiviral reverse transcriptase Drt2 n=1 Tax=unclassified Marinomonas TaxID=196814 RepID=UPI0007AF65DB|nr:MULTISPECIES: antiviral reverse transcriptase Drt2 [unclassified Marinomonas]KZM43031.1 DNA polymerase [Marinomonas sp. SBI22]KZM44601.1 DNA polymerase [Marinomonas sp. SBI8L]
MPSVPPKWFRSRGYLHFDLPVGYKKAVAVVTNPDIVARHAFYPFINYTVKSKKINKDKITNELNISFKERPIAYSSHMDSHIYAYYTKILSKKYEDKIRNSGLENSILAFRGLGKSNIDFAYDAFEKIKKSGECSAVALDFSKFFDTLNHKFLKDSWASLLNSSKLPADHFNVYKSITKFSTVNKLDLYEKFEISINNPKNGRKRVCTAKEFRDIVRKGNLIVPHKAPFGIPQGSPISALLSNIYMFDFDIKMKNYVDECGGEYYRYCDDMLFIVPTELRDEVAGIAQEKVKELGLSINTDKTELRTFKYENRQLKADQMLQYLGFIFDGENIYIRSSSLARYSEKMKRGVSLAKKTMKKYNAIRDNKGLSRESLYKRKLYSRYTHFGGRNFITYGLRAAKKMNSKTIKHQLKPLWRRFNDEIEKF